MPQVGSKPIPKPEELWLSRPPFSLIARIVEVDESRLPRSVSYELYDEDGAPLARINHVSLDQSWWRAFKPMTRRFG